ncbi:MAG: hypothetical protein ACI9ZV_000532 [Candidatus Azotimanducaceae bacterium]|jgi:hypothetical protein
MSEPSKSKIDDLEMAYDFYSDCIEDVQAYISRKTGEIVCDKEAISGEPCPVENIEEDPDYLLLPDAFDLDLNGSRLVWRFVGGEIPGLEPKVRQIFSRKGAYRRWKDFLEDLDLLDKWYSFENETKRQALLDWCKANKIPIQ